MMDNHNRQSIRLAADFTKTLGCSRDAVEKMKNYVGQSDSAERPCIQEDVNHNLEWKPCPFSHMGWKYKRSGELNQSMNHSLRLDSLT